MISKYRVVVLKRKRAGKPVQYYWRLVASNGKRVGDGSEGYNRKSTMLRVVAKIFPAFPVIE